MSYYRLSTTLLLVAAGFLLRAVYCVETVVTCEGRSNVHRLNCDDGVISVLDALYGRADRSTCSEGRPAQQLSKTDCSLPGTLHTIKRRCDGKKACELDQNSFSDPCRGIYKYLETNFTCLPAHHLAACEHSYAHLQCDEGQIIFVIGADYGRRDQTTCSFRRPASQIEKTDCSADARKVAERCNKKNSCTIRASNAVFGDPCGGIYKYLEVAYLCEYPGIIPDSNV